MMREGVRFRIYVGLFAVLMFALGGSLPVLAPSLPYGHYAPLAEGAIFVVGVAALGVWIRSRYLASALTESKEYVLPVQTLPRETGQTFIGRGFAWQPAHASRLRDLALEEGDRESPQTDPAGGYWPVHGVGADRSRNLFLPNPLLTQHLLALGTTGSGKSRFLELLVEQSISRGDAVVVIDPKGDERLLDRTYDAAVRAGRADRFRFFALPYPFSSCRYNPLAHYVRANEITDRIALVLPRGGGDAESFRNFAWDFVNTVVTALDILKERISIAALQNYCLHNTWLLVRKLLKFYCPDLNSGGDLKDVMSAYRAWTAEKGKGILELDQLIKMASLERPYFEKVSSALKPVFSKLMSRTVGYLLCPGEVEPPDSVAASGPAPELSWRAIDEERLVVYFLLGSMLGPETASGVARMCLADLQGWLGTKYVYQRAENYGRISVIVDEMGDVLAPENVHLLNKARGAELSISLACQSLADLDVALRSPADARRVLANIGTFLSFRTQNPEDSDFFSSKCGMHPMRVATESESYEPALFSSGNRAIDDFAFRSSRSLTTRDQALVPSYLLGQLPRAHFFASHSGRVWKAAFPLLDPPRERYSTRLKGSDS